MAATLTSLFGLGLILTSSASTIPRSQSCDTIQHGYVCESSISHSWGQYSPYFSVSSDISPNIPKGCSVTFAQILSRHGARDPTASKTASYNKTVAKIHASGKVYNGSYAFLNDYEYTLGADQLTTFGQQQMVNSGIKFYQRYEALTRDFVPFVRSSSESRVVESAQNFTQGFAASKIADKKAQKCNCFPEVDVIISEDAGSNNTLNHDLCTSFEDGPDSDIAAAAQTTWMGVFVPSIQARINAALGTNLTQTEIIYVMDRECNYIILPFLQSLSPRVASGSTLLSHDVLVHGREPLSPTMEHEPELQLALRSVS